MDASDRQDDVLPAPPDAVILRCEGSGGAIFARQAVTWHPRDAYTLVAYEMDVLQAHHWLLTHGYERIEEPLESLFGKLGMWWPGCDGAYRRVARCTGEQRDTA